MERNMEYRMDRAEEDIKRLQYEQEQMHKDLAKLINTLNSIKFWLYGVGSFYVINEVGFMPIIKKFLGL